ncbi:hypothetical protein [Photobacterium damselae]
MKKRIWIPIVGLVLVSFTSIPRVTYYKVMKYVLEPSIWNESVVITGTKPKNVNVISKIGFKYCNIYDSNRFYEYKAKDLGTTYRLELPILNKGNNCQQIFTLKIDTTAKRPFMDNFHTGWGFSIFNSKSFNNKVTGKITNNKIINLFCTKEGVCQQGKTDKDTIEGITNRSFHPTISEENLSLLTKLTINFGK